MKQAACLVCRRSKIRCLQTPHQGRCERCIALGCECVRPGIHVGRQKGIKNKRVGLDKALFQIEEAVRRKRRGSHQTAEDERVVIRLHELLRDADAAADGSPSFASQDHTRDEMATSSSEVGDEVEDEATLDQGVMSEFVQRTEESLAIDDAENPLQLLARASYFQPPNEQARSHSSPQRARSDRGRAGPREEPSDSSSLRDFFTSAKVHLDVGDDIDPVSLGLVTEQEAESLFSYFHTNLAHTRWGLDPRIYTVAFTRRRSAFLTTSIMAASALFTRSPTAPALSRRLSNHARSLADRVVLRGHRSVEIVLAFMANIPWMFPGQHSTDDDTCRYVAMATTLAIDLSLHKVLLPPDEMLGPGGSRAAALLARGECLDPRTALAIDGFGDVDPWSERGTLLLRNRERAWISLFVLERGMSLARGRPFTVPMTRSLKDCDHWHRSPLADPQDGHVVSMAVLRRNLDGLFSTVRALCDGCQTVSSDGSLIAQSIESAIERFFDQWYTEWGASIGTGPERILPPYVEILVTHTRLSTYGAVINHPTAPLEVRQFFRTAGLSAALNVMRVAIQGEPQLRSMPNNTAIMISFAACFALAISAHVAAGTSALAPSVRKLIDETAGVLERVGAATPQRNGLSVLYGRYLRQIVRRTARGAAAAAASASARDEAGQLGVSVAAAAAAPEAVEATPAAAAQLHAAPMTDMASAGRDGGGSLVDPQLLWPEALQFSAMSDDQIVQVLNQPGNEFEASLGAVSWDEMNNFEWLQWPEFGV